MRDCTLVVTSSNRYDLLKDTLFSLKECIDARFGRVIIVEDSPTAKPDWLGLLNDLGPIEWLANGARRGQVYSIDRAYELVDTPYIFHCEDDWLFCQQGFMAPSREILEKHSDILQVWLRHDSGHPDEQLPGYGFSTKVLDWSGGWSGFSWNPGLRRTADYWRIGGAYGRYSGYGHGTNALGPELRISQRYAELGYRAAILPRNHVRHLGGNRSVHCGPIYQDTVIKQPPKTLIIIPACHTYDYDCWQADIHVNGDSQLNRIQAMRNSWLQDVAAHSPYLEYKFFYGRAAKGRVRDPQADEVFLDVADDYKSLPLKVSAAFNWARNKYERIYKCDDDTYCWVDRLVRDMLSPEWENEPYYGYKHLHGYITGGAGYILGGAALRRLCDTTPNDYSHWAEDVSNYWLLEKQGILGKYNPGHQPGFAAHWFNIDSIDSKGRTIVRNSENNPQEISLRAIHAVKPADMISLYKRMRGD